MDSLLRMLASDCRRDVLCFSLLHHSVDGVGSCGVTCAGAYWAEFFERGGGVKLADARHVDSSG